MISFLQNCRVGRVKMVTEMRPGFASSGWGTDEREAWR